MAMTREQALARAERWINEDRPAGQRQEIGLHEFDLGFVVWPIEPAPADTSRPPAAVGGARGVVDRATGELSTWPSLPVPVIVERYRQQHAAAPRFPEDVRAVLERAGWFPGRSIAAEIDRWAAEVTAHTSPAGNRHELFSAARAVLDEFGGLRIVQEGHGDALGRFPFAFYPAHNWLPDPDLYVEFGAQLGRRVFPLGVHDDGPSELAVDEDGRVFLLHWSDDLLEGDTIDAALTTLIRGAEPRRPAREGMW